ncbi:MAG: asparagine--tRNA ligase [Planctomycetota bacterium]|jgi:asparaginyl-tRNA synthetase|nr:asparagine--tRNA ligase [Gemmataceae bacterium]MCY2969574.1 asparagine--tRNA ligase [Planctomycetota bacterium]RLS57031.1 MAG: asparagine--tRNA ligase [Planctomycetota bacterium]RLS86559.1 MAG: asparagine--tRNA ligase [Planctomycetota bacterium]
MAMECVATARKAESIGKKFVIKGWVRTRRDSKGGFSFLEINDGSSFGNLQVIANNTLENYQTDILKIGTGCSVVIEGMIKGSPAKGQETELVADSVQVIGWADPNTYTMQKKGHTFEYLRTQAHLRPRTNTFGAVARVRNQISKSIHDFYQEQGFLYINTPIITPSDCEGAGHMFRVTTLDFLNPKTIAKAEDDFFGKPVFLTVSGQLEGETYACGLGKIYTFGPTFRAENSNTSRHLAEFWMVEPEVAFNDLIQNMDLAESFIKRIIRDVLNNCGEDMQFFEERIEKGLIQNLELVLNKDFKRISYTEAVEILKNSGQTFEFEVAWGKDLQSEHERYLAEKHFNGPVILYDYPKEIKAFYMRLNDDGKTVRAMDVLVPRIGEIIGGSQREERLELLESRMRSAGLKPEDYWWYLDLRRFGGVPHSGFGLGLERCVQFITGMANIRDVIPYPRTPGSADF